MPEETATASATPRYSAKPGSKRSSIGPSESARAQDLEHQLLLALGDLRAGKGIVVCSLDIAREASARDESPPIFTVRQSWRPWRAYYPVEYKPFREEEICLDVCCPS